MALVLVEGEERLPNMLGVANLTSTTKDPQSSIVAVNNASGWGTYNIFRQVLVMGIATILASL